MRKLIQNGALLHGWNSEIAAKTWISLSNGTKYRKDNARFKLRPFHIKSIVCRSLNLAVGSLFN